MADITRYKKGAGFYIFWSFNDLFIYGGPSLWK